MKSRLMTKTPTNCGNCEFYHAQPKLPRSASGICFWRIAPVHFKFITCDDRLKTPADQLRRQLIIASENYLHPPRRRKPHVDTRQDSFL